MAAKVVGPGDGKAGFLGSIGVRFMIDGAESSGGFSLVEHPMSARGLAAPLHRHAREDEYSYVGRHQLEVDPASIPGLVKRFDLRFPGEPI